MTFTFWVAMAVEKTTIIHACYLMQHFFSWLAGKPIVSNEGPPRSPAQAIFFWGASIMPLV
jgi:hypothetical protein